MNVLVTGAGGQLGTAIRGISGGSADNYVFTDISEAPGISALDITDIGAVRRCCKANGTDIIVNCAAYTDVDAAENDYDGAERLNAYAPACLAEVMRESGGLLIHISTDYVFGDCPCDTPCREDLPAAPAGVYGLTKLHGEQRVLESGCNSVIVRTAWLYSETGRNFCRTMINLTSSRPSLKVVSDQVGTPTYAGDLASAIAAVIDDYRKHGNSHNGIYHYSNEGSCSWYEFACRIRDLWGNDGCEIHPCTSAEYPSPVRRPAYSVLDKTKIKRTFGLEIPSWDTSLRKCIDNIRNETA